MKIQLLTKRLACLILGFVLVTVLFSSCNKDDDADDSDYNYMISFKADGVLEEYPMTNENAGSFYEDATSTQFGLRFTDIGKPSTIYLDVYDNKMITESSYSGYVVTPAAGQKPAYIVGAKLAYYNDAQSTHSTGLTDAVVSVGISEITKASVRGTFSGKLKAKGKPDVEISEGKFFVRIANPY
jgi:hypothetical protein